MDQLKAQLILRNSNPYAPRETEEDLWAQYCFSLYRFAVHVKALQTSMEMIIDASLVVRPGSSKAEYIDELIDRTEREIQQSQASRQSTEHEMVNFWLFEDLKELGHALLSKGPTLDELVGIAAFAAYAQVEQMREDLKPWKSSATRTWYLLRNAEEKYPREYRSLKKNVREILKLMPGGTYDMEPSKLGYLTRQHILPEFGLIGCWVAIDSMYRSKLEQAANKSKREYKQRSGWIFSSLAEMIMTVLDRHEIEPRFRVGARLINGLTCQPQYRMRKGGDPDRTMGEETFRSWVRTHLR